VARRRSCKCRDVFATVRPALSEVFDAPFTLAEMFEQFEPIRMSERLSDLGETSEHALFGTGA